MNDKKKNMCDEDDSDEILEYTGGSELSDLTFITTYDYYSSWRIKEVFSVAGYDLQPVYLGYKALRYRPCQRYWIVDKKTNQRIGSSNNGYSFEDLRYFLGGLGIPLHGENYHPTRDKDGRRTSCQEFLELVESLDNPADQRGCVSMLESYSDVLTAEDLMVILHIGRSKVYELLRENTIPNLRIGKKYIIPKQLLIDFLINNQANT